MKIFFTGSINGHKPGTMQNPSAADEPLLRAARELGYETAKSRHIALLRNVASRNTIDHYVFNGAGAYCSDHPQAGQRVTELHIPSSIPLSVQSASSNLRVDVHYHPDLSGAASGPGPVTYIGFLAATIVALDEADVVITLGDGESVRFVGTLAGGRDVPVLAISCFGGSSREMYERLYYKYRSEFEKTSSFAPLNNPWTSESAPQVIALAESYLARAMGRAKHSYFISYSHNDMAVADSVELQFLRQHRIVYRDDQQIRAGNSLTKSIAAMISKSNTFVAIGSSSYLSSEWCEAEMAYALESPGC